MTFYYNNHIFFGAININLILYNNNSHISHNYQINDIVIERFEYVLNNCYYLLISFDARGIR